MDNWTFFGGINIGISDRFDTWSKSYFDTSKLEFDVTTRIPVEMLVNIICDFYWNIGHNEIRLDILKPNNEKPYTLYKPGFQLEKSDSINEILVHTFNGQNKQKFDSVCFNFENDGLNRVKILGLFGLGYKLWHFVYFIIALGISFYLAGFPQISGPMATIVFSLLMFLMFVIGARRLRKVEKHPSVPRYKREFEEHIRMKEKELFPELYE